MHTYYLYIFSLKNMQHTPFHGNNIFSACNKFTLTYSLTHFSPFIGFLSPDFSYFHTHGCILFQSLSIASPTYLLLLIHKIPTLLSTSSVSFLLPYPPSDIQQPLSLQLGELHKDLEFVQWVFVPVFVTHWKCNIRQLA